MQRIFGNASASHKILYIDRDILSAAFAVNGEQEDVANRIKQIKTFVNNKLNIVLPDGDADQISDGLLLGANVSFLLKSEKQKSLCGDTG